LNLDSENELYVSRLALWSLPVSDDIYYEQRNVRLVATLKSDRNAFKKSLDCFSFFHPQTNEVRNIYVNNNHILDDVILDSNNGFKETIVMEYISDISAEDLNLDDFEFDWKC